MIRPFPEDFCVKFPSSMDNPFRYSPHPLVQKAAEMLMQEIDSSEDLSLLFSEGKMLGVLAVEAEGKTGYLAAFSGNVGGKSIIDGFVPPIYDLTDPDGYFKTKEAEISALNRDIKEFQQNGMISSLKAGLKEAERNMQEETSMQKARMALLKHKRDEIRSETEDPSGEEELIRQSQHEKAELRRIKRRWEEKIATIRSEIHLLEESVEEMKRRRAEMSDELQKWIFTQYVVRTSDGKSLSISDIFAEQGLVPPGGTGECAAPKLLNYCFAHGYTPLCMGEFWYGQSPETAVRTHGHFYPSCTSKCGPLLKRMLNGFDFSEDTVHGIPEILHEDNSIIVASKPSGMPSVPGLDGKVSMLEWIGTDKVEAVHRLDMDTSGLIIFAKNEKAATCLRQQFQEHTVHKTYHARLSNAPEGCTLKSGDKGIIRLPLSADYDERPRQKVDTSQGKEAMTEYEITSISQNGTIEVIFKPFTGRTHQLRVHSAHIRGLGHPIAGDLLYGGAYATRLCLHAAEITFIHPESGSPVTFQTELNHYR